MKTKLIIIAFVSLLSIGGLSSCVDEDIYPIEENQPKDVGSTNEDKDGGF